MPQRKIDSFLTPMAVRVDQSAGAMSISPSGRDIVLASRNGLYVIDINNTYNPPRWLHHLTSWEVADVQWSPHSSRPNWVISTSNQKALLWDLNLPSSRAIERVVHGHSRAITDINFHSKKPEILATSSIDSFVHCWDLRNSRKPIQTFGDFFSGANQVKWNRYDSHMLASCHDTRILIWDDRANSVPLYTIHAHDLKVNDLDFSRTSADILMSSSNDRTVKVWNLKPSQGEKITQPEFTISTDFPVGKARHTPFGTGCAIMPLRGGNNSVSLIDISPKKRPLHSVTTLDPVHEFSAHTGPVREFLWRTRGGQNPKFEDRQFQLVTWAKDNDVRFWPVKQAKVEKLGYVRGNPITVSLTRLGAEDKSYHPEPKPEHEREEKPTIRIQTNSFGSSPKPSVQMRPGSFLSNHMQISQSYKDRHGQFFHVNDRHSHKRSHHNKISRRHGPAIMTASGGPSAFAFNYSRNNLEWLDGVRIGPSALENITDRYDYDNNSDSDSGHPPVLISNLGDEITQFHQKFPLITFEMINVAEGEIVISVNTSSTTLTGDYDNPNDLVALTVHVKFPPEYPSKAPEFNIVRNYKVSPEGLPDLAYELALFAENCAKKSMYCLEPCMRIILGEKMSTSENPNDVFGIDAPEYGTESQDLRSQLFDDDDDDDDENDDDDNMPLSPVSPTSSIANFNEFNAGAPRINLKNYPRTCGGVWSKTGQLVCFFSPQYKNYRGGGDDFNALSGVDSQLVRGTSASNDLIDNFDFHSGAEDYDSYIYYSSDDDASVTSFKPTTMALTSSQRFAWPNSWRYNSRAQVSNRPWAKQNGGNSIAGRSQGTNGKFAYLNDNQPRNCVKVINQYSYLIPAQPELAKEYEIMGRPPHLLCQHNCKVAEKYNRSELANCWKLLEMILTTEVPISTAHDFFSESFTQDGSEEEGQKKVTFISGQYKWGNHPFGRQWLIEQLFEYFEKRQDPQMLANMSCILLTAFLNDPNTVPKFVSPSVSPLFVQATHRRKASSFYMDSVNHSPKMSYDDILQMSAEITQAASMAVPSLARSADSTPTSTATAAAMALPSKNLPSSVTKTRNWFGSVDSECLEPDGYKEEQPFGASLSSPKRSQVSTRRPIISTFRTESMLQNIPAVGKTNNNSGNTAGTTGEVDFNLGPIFGTNPATRSMSHNSFCDTQSIANSRNGLVTDAFRLNGESLAQGVRFTFFNEELLKDSENLNPIYFLDQPKENKYKSYRMQYAALLFSWGLKIESLEVLKFNYMKNPEIYHTNGVNNKRRVNNHHYNGRFEYASSMESMFPKIKQPDSSIFNDFHYSDIRFANSVTRACQFCRLNVTLHERCFFCLNCEHILHAQCAEEWFLAPSVSPFKYEEANDDTEPWSEPNLECPSGCGCICMDTIQSNSSNNEGFLI